MAAQNEPPSFQDSFVFRNEEDKPVEIMLEPWAPVFLVEIGETLRLIGVSPVAGGFEGTREGNFITLYGWEGSTVKVYKGEDLIEDCSTAFPSLSNGMSPREFVDWMFKS